MKKLLVASHYFRFLTQPRLRRIRGLALLLVLLASAAGLALWTRRAAAFANNLGSWGTAGSGDGQFAGPLGVAIDLVGNVYVVDSGNNRIQKFTSAGVFVSKFGQSGAGEGQFQHPYAVAADRVGNLYVADSDNHRIEKFDTSGNFLLQWGGHGTG